MTKVCRAKDEGGKKEGNAGLQFLRNMHSGGTNDVNIRTRALAFVEKTWGVAACYSTWELEKFPQQYSFSHKLDPKKCHRPSRNAHYFDKSDSNSLLRENFHKLQRAIKDYNFEFLCFKLD